MRTEEPRLHWIHTHSPRTHWQAVSGLTPVFVFLFYQTTSRSRRLQLPWGPHQWDRALLWQIQPPSASTPWPDPPRCTEGLLAGSLPTSEYSSQASSWVCGRGRSLWVGDQKSETQRNDCWDLPNAFLAKALGVLTAVSGTNRCTLPSLQSCYLEMLLH